MTGEERRVEILNSIKNAKSPISGTTLSQKYHVSRQVIVQDIALLRAAKHGIFSTTRGYLLNAPAAVTKVFCVTHTDSQIEDELNTIVDMGGRVLDVFVEHGVYGQLRADLQVSSRRNVSDFIKQIETGEALPLKNLTSGKHWHTVEADSEQVLEIVEDALRQKGYLT